MKNTREVYGFTHEAKRYVRDRANGHCEVNQGRDCNRPNTNRVNHITGICEAIRIGMRPEDVSNPKLNATMQCEVHERIHDEQERDHLASLPLRTIYERKRPIS